MVSGGGMAAPGRIRCVACRITNADFEENATIRTIAMNSFIRNNVITVCAVALAASTALQGQTAPKQSAGSTAKKPAAASKPQKSALNKAVLEAYLRHLSVWEPPVNVEISDPQPSSQLPGFEEITVRASMGAAHQEETFLVTKDGQKIVRATVYDVNESPFKADLAKLKTESSQPNIGASGAPVVIVLFTDFECPFCKEVAKMLRENLISAYPKQVHLYFKDFPLESIHPWAKTASIAGRCIFRRDAAAFWPYHDWVYEHQSEITADNFKDKLSQFAQANGIDTLQLTRCLDNRATEAEVDKSIAEGKALGINSTPTMFVNGRRLVGNIPWPNLREIIDYEINYQKTAWNAGEECSSACEVKVPSPVGN